MMPEITPELIAGIVGAAAGYAVFIGYMARLLRRIQRLERAVNSIADTMTTHGIF